MRDNTQVQMEKITFTPEGNIQEKQFRLTIQYQTKIYDCLVNPNVFNSEFVEIEDLEKVLLEAEGKNADKMDPNLNIYTVLEVFTQPNKHLKISIEFDLKIGKLKRKKETITLILPKISTSFDYLQSLITKLERENDSLQAKITKMDQDNAKILESLQEKFTKLEQINATQKAVFDSQIQELNHKFLLTKQIKYGGEDVSNSDTSRILLIDMNQKSLFLVKKQYSGSYDHCVQGLGMGLQESFTFMPKLDQTIYQPKYKHNSREFQTFFMHYTGLKQLDENTIQDSFKNPRRIVEIVLNYIVNVRKVLNIQVLETGSIIRIRFLFNESCPLPLSADGLKLKYRIVPDNIDNFPNSWEHFKHVSKFTLIKKFLLPSLATSQTFYFVEMK